MVVLLLLLPLLLLALMVMMMQRRRRVRLPINVHNVIGQVQCSAHHRRRDAREISRAEVSPPLVLLVFDSRSDCSAICRNCYKKSQQQIDKEILSRSTIRELFIATSPPLAYD